MIQKVLQAIKPNRAKPDETFSAYMQNAREFGVTQKRRSAKTTTELRKARPNRVEAVYLGPRSS